MQDTNDCAKGLTTAMLNFALDENSFLYLVLRYWVPSLLSIIAGGLFASVLIPRWQARWSKNRAQEDRRVELYETIAEHFSLYITAWRRLIEIATLEATRPLSEQEAERKQAIVAHRTEERDELLRAFSKSSLFFSAESDARIEAFLEWDECNGAKRLDELPEIDEWKRREKEILSSLRRDLRR